MFDDLLKFSVKEVAVAILLSVLIVGGGVAAIVAFVPRDMGGEVAPPTPPISPPPVIAETATVTVPPAVVIPPIVSETEPILASLELNQSEGGMAVADCNTDCEHEAGWQTSITATANAGYEFLQWTCSLPCTNFDLTDIQVNLSVNSDITISPLFIKSTSLELNQSEGGTVVADCDTDCSDIPGWQATVTAIPSPGYEFVSWASYCSPHLCSSENPLVLELRRDITVTPIFRLELRADDFAVTVGASSATWLNPLLYVYDPGEQGSDGVDVDRDTLQIISVTPVSGTAQIVDEGRAVIYTPASNADQSDSFAYTVQTTAQDITKTVSGLVTVTIEREDLAENLTELNSLLQRHFDADTDASVRANFRFTDGQVTNQDLAIVSYFAEQNFSDDSVQLIMGLGADLSPLSAIDQYSLTKLNSIEKSLYQNPVFVNNPHGTANWPADYTKIMKQASFIIPSRIAVIDGLKHIYYDKLVIDEIFEDLGGEYTGVFSRGQNYTPFWVATEDATQEQIDSYREFNRLHGRSPNSNGYFGLYVYDQGRAYLDALTHPKFHWNELTINFSILATLDSVGYTLGDKLIEKNDTELFFLFDPHSDLEKHILRTAAGTFGGHSYVISWEVGVYSNEESNNLYNLARNIIGKNISNQLEGVFRLFNWLLKEKKHEIGSPYFPNETSLFTLGNQEIEVNALIGLPNNAFFPSAYNFIERDKGGIYFSNSFNMAGHITAGLRSLGVSSEQFTGDIVNEDSHLKSQFSIKYLERFFAPDYSTEVNSRFNFGLVLIENTPWFYEANFPFRSSVGEDSYKNLISQENFTVENLRKVDEGEISNPGYFNNNTDLKAEYESLIGS